MILKGGFTLGTWGCWGIITRSRLLIGKSIFLNCSKGSIWLRKKLRMFIKERMELTIFLFMGILWRLMLLVLWCLIRRLLRSMRGKIRLKGVMKSCVEIRRFYWWVWFLGDGVLFANFERVREKRGFVGVWIGVKNLFGAKNVCKSWVCYTIAKIYKTLGEIGFC